MKDKFTIWCEECDHKWTQEVLGLGEVDWTCPKCNSADDSALIKYEPGDKAFHKKELELGKGGALHA